MHHSLHELTKDTAWRVTCHTQGSRRLVILNSAQREKLSSCLRQSVIFLYLYSQIILGAILLVASLMHWQSRDPLRFTSFLVSAAIASAFKVRLPGVTGTMSVSFLFAVIGIMNLSLSETMAVGAVSVLVQCLWHARRRPPFTQLAFNVSSRAIAVYACWLTFSYLENHTFELVSLGVLSVAYYFANTFPIAGVIALTEQKPLRNVWAGYGWMLPYYVVATSLAWLIARVPPTLQWEIPIICLPVVYLVHRSYRTYLVQMEQDKKHFEELNSLHLRTIETLALAIDAKDHTTHDHLQRVQLYAVEIGKDLGLSELELDALRAAAVLHDIGKLAVPEHIISKPGKLTRAEFEKMKVHPVVGAEILERVEFPYPVVPIVRAHHEKWDGSGYPYGLKSEEIPIGARILAAVDCLDALASDRQYRRALPLDEAMSKVAAEAGTSFDPSVVNALNARYRELEQRAQAVRPNLRPPLSKDLKITRGGAPAAGFEREEASGLNALAEACSPKRLDVLRADPDRSLDIPGDDDLNFQETLAVMAVRLRSVITFDAMAVFTSKDGVLTSEFVTGDDHRLLGSLCIPQGQGLSGWVAEVGKPILNGNPAVEPGYSGVLGSALAVPLVDNLQTIGVLVVYRIAKDAFSADEMTPLLPLSRSLAALLVESRQQALVRTKSLAAPVYSIRKGR